MKQSSSSDWRDLARLGEQLLSAASLAEQRNRVVDVAARLLGGEAELWLSESIFRLPNTEHASIFSPEPTTKGMQRAMAGGRIVAGSKGGKSKSAAHPSWASIPLIDRGAALGAIQITRPKGPVFKRAAVKSNRMPARSCSMARTCRNSPVVNCMTCASA